MSDKVTTLCHRTMAVPRVPGDMEPSELGIYLRAQRILSDPKELRANKIQTLEFLLRGGWKLQRLAIAHLSTPKWISYMKRYPSGLARYVEKIAKKQITFQQYIDMSPEEVDVGVCAYRIWKKIEGEISMCKMRTRIEDRYGLYDRWLWRVEKRGLGRLYRSVTSFLPPRKCR